MKKAIFSLLFAMGLFATAFANGEKTSVVFRFTEKTTTIEAKSFKDAVLLRLPKVVIIDIPEEKSFCLLDISSKAEQDLLKSLRDPGWNVIHDPKHNDIHTYVVQPTANADTILKFEVDSSAFQDNINRLKEIQQILGAAVIGGKNDPFETRKGDLLGVKDKLCIANIACKLSKTKDGFETMTLTERPCPVYLQANNILQVTIIVNILNSSAIKYTMDDQIVAKDLFTDDFRKLQQKLQDAFGTTTIETVNFTYIIVPAEPKNYTLQAVLVGGSNYEERLQKLLDTLKAESTKIGFLFESHEVRETGPVRLVEIRLASYEKQNVLENKLRNLLTNKCAIKRNRITLTPAEE